MQTCLCINGLAESGRFKYNGSMSVMYIIAQSLGIVATLCFLVSFQVKTNRGLYLCQAAGCLAFALQFLLLGAIGGGVSQLFIIVRNMMLSKYNNWSWVRWKGWVIIFLAIAVLLTWWTWDGWTNLLPLIPMSAGTIALWTNNAGVIRLVNMCICSPAWIVFDIITGAYSAILNELVVIGSAGLSIYRYGMKELLDPESEFQKGK